MVSRCAHPTALSGFCLRVKWCRLIDHRETFERTQGQKGGIWGIIPRSEAGVRTADGSVGLWREGLIFCASWRDLPKTSDLVSAAGCPGTLPPAF